MKNRMRIAKHIVSVCLAAMLCFGMSVSTFAGNYGDEFSGGIPFGDSSQYQLQGNGYSIPLDIMELDDLTDAQRQAIEDLDQEVIIKEILDDWELEKVEPDGSIRYVDGIGFAQLYCVTDLDEKLADAGHTEEDVQEGLGISGGSLFFHVIYELTSDGEWKKLGLSDQVRPSELAGLCYYDMSAVVYMYNYKGGASDPYAKIYDVEDKTLVVFAPHFRWRTPDSDNAAGSVGGTTEANKPGAPQDNNGAQTSQTGQESDKSEATVTTVNGTQASQTSSVSDKSETITTTVNGVVVTQKEVTQSDLNDVQKNILGTYFTAMQNIEQDATLSAEQKQNKKAENVQAWINSALGVNYSYKNGVYGVYDLKASDLSQTIPILVDGVKAGDQVVIAHLKADGTWEKVAAAEVGDGVVYAKFDSLSPVFVAVLHNSNSTVSPKTADANLGIFFAIAAVAALGIAVDVRRRTLAD